MKSDPQISQIDSDKNIRDKEAVYQEALEREFVYNLRESMPSADNMRGVDL